MVAGYGLSGRVSQPCDQGTWNEGDNYGAYSWATLLRV